MELQLQKLLRSNAPLPASASLLFFHILPHPEKVHFSTTVFGIFALFLFGFYFCVPVSVFDFPSLRLAHVQQKYSTCHSFFSMYIYRHAYMQANVCVCASVCVWNCIRLVLKVALYMHILCAWPKPIGCPLQFCAAYFFSTPPHLGYPNSSPFLGSSSSGNRLPRPLRLWPFLLQRRPS